MKFQYITHTLCCASAILLGCPLASAISSSFFAENSKLASGHWAKLEIKTDGIYELTDSELKSLGFNNPSKVKIFGHRGIMLSESLEALTYDDIQQIPALYTNGKLCFYGSSPFQKSYVSSSTEPFVRLTANSYSRASYYFITDNEAYTAMDIPVGSQSSSATNDIGTSYNFYHHERELCSPSSSGKTLLGEDFGTSNKLDFDFSLSNLVPDSKIDIYTSVVAKVDDNATVKATLNSTDVQFSPNTNRISKSTSEYVFYNSALCRGTVTPAYINGGKMKLSLSLDCDGTTTIAKLDYFTLTYQQQNTLDADSSQLNMLLFGLVPNTDRISIAGASASSIVLDVTNPESPVQFRPTFNGTTGLIAPSSQASSVTQDFVIFDPLRTLRKVASAKVIDCQNLHRMDVPDMVIITSPALKEQAQRIADMHKSMDNMAVAVVEQEHIFNEFSSGAPDAMAIRAFMKMLYSRNPSKLKYLLLFGGGSFDNRRLIGNKSENLLLTYQSTISNDETHSYTCDNFFGMLADGKGYNLSSTPISIAVGRMPVKTIDEATSAVDKLLKYVSDNDFNNDWRNNILLVADKGDNDIHMYQTEGLMNSIISSCHTRPIFNKIYNEAYTTDPQGFAVDARRKLTSDLKRGQLVMTYVGHGGPKNLTKLTQLWRVDDAKDVTYEHLPFCSFASCDVARFDSDVRGIAEEMFHTPNGGMIAGMAASRAVYVSDNDILNTALVKALFYTDETGKQNTIGEAFCQAMKAFGNSGNSNKLNFQLLGDPAMKLNYPNNYATITSVNGTDVTASGSSATIYPMTKVAVAGKIYDANGNFDNSFNGNVTVSLLDKARFYKNISLYEPQRDIYQNRELLNKANGRVVNGEYTVELLVPQNCMAQDEIGAMAVYANRDNSRYSVNGYIENVKIASLDKGKAIADTKAPVITEMYLNSPSFSNGDAVLPAPVLHIGITDDFGICSQTLAIGNALKLVLDGGNTSYSDARNIVNLSESGKKATINLQLDELSCGKHSVTLFVSDLAGNQATQTIDFFVQSPSAEAELNAESKDVRDSAVFNLTHNFTNSTPSGTIFVIDSNGNTVWQTTTSSFPYEWNLLGNNGTRVAPGLYRYYCILSAENQHASTQMQTLVILGDK